MPDSFHPAVAAWFAGQFPAPTPAQARAWPLIRAQRNVLIAAPTGSGKTLAAFLAAIDALVVEGLASGLADATAIVYVSPLKALSNDVRRNLEELAEVTEAIDRGFQFRLQRVVDVFERETRNFAVAAHRFIASRYQR